MKRAPGRPRTFDADAAMRNVSQAFGAGGFSATSLDEISQATGLQRPSLYGAFGDKKAMYLASLEMLGEDISATADRLDGANLCLCDTLAQLFSGSIAGYLSGETGPRGCLAVCTASAEAVNDADIRDYLNRFLNLIDERISNWFERAGSPDPIGKARLVAAALHSISVRARAGQPKAVLDAMAKDLLDLIEPDSNL